MSKVSRVIVLAAGQGYQLDGFNKLFLKDPATGELNLERYLCLFERYEISVVIGYKAVSVMNDFPQLHYVLNSEWMTTGSGYSLSLAIDERPSIIKSSDLFFDEKMGSDIGQAPDNSVFVSHPENKHLNPERVKVGENDRVIAIYQGEGADNDPETAGIYKIHSPQILRQWKKNCRQNKSFFAGLNLPLDIAEVYAVNIDGQFCYDVNTPLDYLNLIKMRHLQNAKKRSIL